MRYPTPVRATRADPAGGTCISMQEPGFDDSVRAALPNGAGRSDAFTPFDAFDSMKAVMKFIQWLQQKAAPESLTGPIKSPGLRNAVAGFALNVKRLEWLLIMPFEVWNLAIQ